VLEANVHQQVENGIPTEANRMPIQQNVESTCALRPVFQLRAAQSPINKFNRVSVENSMFHSGMGFFVFPVQALVNVSKRD
jgi:hypothetical protein